LQRAKLLLLLYSIYIVTSADISVLQVTDSNGPLHAASVTDVATQTDFGQDRASYNANITLSTSMSWEQWHALKGAVVTRSLQVTSFKIILAITSVMSARFLPVTYQEHKLNSGKVTQTGAGYHPLSVSVICDFTIVSVCVCVLLFACVCFVCLWTRMWSDLNK